MRKLALVSVIGLLALGALCACAEETPPPAMEVEEGCTVADCMNLLAPEVVSVEPRGCDVGCAAAPVDSAIRIRFTEPIDPSIATGAPSGCVGPVVVWPAGVDPAVGPCVDGIVSVNVVEVAFTPLAPLLPSTRYQVYVGGGIRDLSGAPLFQPLQWEFSTQAPALCGNGEQTADEACDDGNALDGDYCAADCHLATGECGDALVQGAVEACDDGNDVSGDGCSPRCKLEIREPLALPGVAASCGLRRDGSVRCWGGPLDTTPDGVFAELAVGDGFACAVGDLAASGVGRSLTCWGEHGSPVQAVEVDRLIAGGAQLCGLDAAGGARCFGMGQGETALQLPGQGFARLALGPGVLCGLDAEGAVTCAGDLDASALAGQRGLLAVAAGDGFVCVLDAAGVVQCLGGGEGARGLANPPAGPFVDIVAGGQVVCGQQASQVLVCWNAGGGAAHSPGTRPMVSFALGPHHGCGVTVEDEAVCWGLDAAGAALDVPIDFP